MWSGELGHRLMRHRFGFAASVASCFVVAFLMAAAARAAAPQRKATPQDAATGYVIVGPSQFDWGNNGVTIGAAAIKNDSGQPSADQGLFLSLYAYPVQDGVPTIGNLNWQDIAGGGIALGTLASGQEFTNVFQSGLTFTPPPAGCYYVSLALVNGADTVDVWTIAAKKTAFSPDATGYAVFSFGGASCPAPTSCSHSTHDGCLIGGRFLVATTFYNANDGKAQAQVLSFAGGRAESDESVFYYFTDPSNFELGVKVLDACGLSNTFWVFIGGLTNQGWTVNVLDTQTGRHKAYINDLPNVTVTTTDTAALPCP
jgi:hypothetical protein